MYDMYPWDKTADPGRTRPSVPQRPASADVPAGSATHATHATLAVQVALDRRDNGGAAEGQARQ